MTTVGRIDNRWEREKPEHWRYEKYMHIHRLESASPTPSLSTKKRGQFDEVFERDTKPWKFKITNDPNKFQDILHTLEDARQLQSQPWAHGSYWYKDGGRPYTPGTFNSEDLLDMASLHKVATKHYNQVYTNVCNEWQCTEAEVYAFQTERSLYNVRVFATLILKAISHEATEYIKVATKNNLRLLNDGPFVWVTLFQYLFPSNDVYNRVIWQQINDLCQL